MIECFLSIVVVIFLILICSFWIYIDMIKMNYKEGKSYNESKFMHYFHYFYSVGVIVLMIFSLLFRLWMVHS